MTTETTYSTIKTLIDQNQRVPGFPKFADEIISHPECIPELVDLAGSDDVYPYPQYSAWLLLHVARKDHSLVMPFYDRVIDGILKTSNMSALRSLLGVSLCLPLTDYEQGRFLDRLLAIINDNNSKPGLVYYTVRKLAEFMEWYPELRREIEMILELRDEMNISPGIVSWSKSILKKKKSRIVIKR